MGLRAGLDKCGKSPPPLGFDPRTVQPEASRYTEYAISALSNSKTAYFLNIIGENTEIFSVMKLDFQRICCVELDKLKGNNCFTG